MNIEIRRLTPDLLQDYLFFFENVAHTDNKRWDRCYCSNYCAANNNRVLQKANMADPQVRRSFAIDYVNRGQIQGYLAYAGENVVGWLNVNNRNDCLHCYGWKHYIADWKISRKTKEKIKSVFCFTVAPNMRGQGIATAMLQRAVEDARSDGYEYMEAYPNKEETDVYYNYVGPVGLYKKLGFAFYSQTKWRLILRKKL